MFAFIVYKKNDIQTLVGCIHLVRDRKTRGKK